MGNWRRWALLLSMVGTVAILGCAGASTRRLADNQESSTRVSWSGSPEVNSNASRDNDPSSTRTLDRVTSTASSAGRSFSDAFKTATNNFSEALQIKPKKVPADGSIELSSMPEQLSPLLYIRGAAFSESKGDLAGAQQQYERALDLDPHHIKTLIAYARFRDRIGNSNQALEVYQRARSVEPNNATVWNDLALCHARRGEVDSALAAMQQAVALRRDDVRYRNNLAAVLVQADRPEDAVRELQQVHAPAVANHNVACLLLRLRNQALAAEYLRRAVSLDPSLQRAQMLLARLNEADATSREQHSDRRNSSVPLGPGATPQLTEDPRNAGDPRNSRWQPASHDASYGSYRQSGGDTPGPVRFPQLEPPVRGAMKRMPAF